LRSDRPKKVYPLYLDSRVSRSEGRRVPRDLAVKKPRAKEILQAARNLGLKAVLVEEDNHPSRWFYREGCVLISSDRPKTELLKMIASEIRKIREKNRK